MNAPALTATLAVHAAFWGMLNLLPGKTALPPRTLRPVSVMYRKPVVAPPPPAPAVAAPPVKRRVHRRAAPKPPKAILVAPPAPLLTTPAAAVVIPVAEAAPSSAAPAGLPQLSEKDLPEGYVEEQGFTFAPLYRVTQAPKLLQALNPEYPPRARELQKEGVVILEVDIDAQGRVVSARIIEESGWGFGAAALKAILRAGFAPARIESTAVPVRYRLPIRFQMDFS
ncbi:MAG: energy transducer TonB [Elusimicrobiota bacterium]